MTVEELIEALEFMPLNYSVVNDLFMGIECVKLTDTEKGLRVVQIE